MQPRVMIPPTAEPRSRSAQAPPGIAVLQWLTCDALGNRYSRQGKAWATQIPAFKLIN